MNRRTPASPLAVLLAVLAALAACTAAPATSPMADATPMMSPSPVATSAGPSATATATEPGEPTPTDAATAGAAPTDEPPDDPLLATELTDARTGETFTLAALAAEDGPVLLEPMAIWCSNCRAQQHQVVEAHALADFSSVSLDVDLSELSEDLARYADQEGWDWHFAMADAELWRLLQERFGQQATHPPSTPLIVIERDGTVRPLEFGVGTRSAEQLIDELGLAG